MSVGLPSDLFDQLIGLGDAFIRPDAWRGEIVWRLTRVGAADTRLENRSVQTCRTSAITLD